MEGLIIMINVAVCDDERIFSELIAEKIQDELQKYDYMFQIDYYTSGIELLTQHESTLYDIVFLDIDMPKINGYETLLQLRELKPDILVVFITHHRGLIYPSYKYHPFMLLTKLDFTSKIHGVVKEVLGELKNIRELDTYYTITRYGHEQSILKRRIIYAEAVHHGAKLHTLDGVFKIRKSLQELYSELDCGYLVFCHRSCIVNVKHVHEIHQNTVLLDNGVKLPLSQRHVTEIIKKI